MLKAFVGPEAQKIQEAAQCVESLANLLERHMVAEDSGHGSVLNRVELGGIVQAMKMAGRSADMSGERLLDAAQGVKS